MKILLISHGCQSLTEGLPKAQCLGETPGIDLQVLVPDRWNFYGAPRAPETPQNPSYRRKIGRVMWPWLGPAQSYGHWYPEMARLLRRFQPDIIDIWEEPWSLVSAQTCFLARRLVPHAKIIAETEQNIDKTLPPPFENIRKYTLNNVDFLVGRSQEAIDHVRRKGYQGASRVVPNAVDIEMFGPLPPQKMKQTRQELGFEGFVAGYVGRLVPEKGLMEMIEALPLLPPAIHFAFIGEGAQETELKARAAQLGVASRAKFLGARPMTELPPIVGALDALILPSRTTATWKEQFGRVIIEAGACGVPVIGSDSGAIPEVVGDAGLIFPEGDASALAGAVLQLHADSGLARRIGQIGLRRARERFSWQQVARQMTEIYREIAA